jgi:ribosome-associated translation inhibitor RaiA
MQVQVNASNGVENKDTLERWADEEIRRTLAHFKADITRVEVHLNSATGERGGASDKRCTMEARLAHQQPVAVTHHAANLDEAFRGAADKLKHLLESKLDKLTDHRDRTSIRSADLPLDEE